MTDGTLLTREEFHSTLQHYATKADLAELKVDLVKWMVSLQLASMGLTVTIILLIVRFFVSP